MSEEMRYLPRKCRIRSTGRLMELQPRDMVVEDMGTYTRKKVETWENPDTGKIYAADEVETIPQTPYELFDVECGEGWRGIIQPLFDYVERHNKDMDEDDPLRIEVLQVKEKFGGLRFYTNYQTAELEHMVMEAEDKSYKVCELCGSEEDVGFVAQGWYATRCRKCMEAGAGGIYGPIWRDNATGRKYIFHDDGVEELPDTGTP